MTRPAVNAPPAHPRAAPVLDSRSSATCSSCGTADAVRRCFVLRQPPERCRHLAQNGSTASRSGLHLCRGIAHGRNRYPPPVVLNLERGCADADEATGELLIRGRAGKGQYRSAAPGDLAAHTRQWVVVGPVHRAVELMESLTGHRYLFPASVTLPGRRRPNDDHARKSGPTNHDIDAFITWVNTAFSAADGSPPIPPDPARRVHAARFRRILSA